MTRRSEPAGLPDHPDSWKHTRFAEGNVQLSFSADASPFPAGGAALVHSADVDIDLGRGLAHAKEWLENNVFKPGHKTNQALVYALLYAQGILPQVHPGPDCGDDAPRGDEAAADAGRDGQGGAEARGSKAYGQKAQESYVVSGLAGPNFSRTRTVRLKADTTATLDSRRGPRAPIIPVRPRRHAYPDQFARVEDQARGRVPWRRAGGGD